MTRSLEDLKALEQRLVSDVSRSRMQDMYGLSNDSPLMKNLRQVKQDIAEWKPEEANEEKV